MDNIQPVEYYLEVERKIIHLMLTHLHVIEEMIEGGFSPDFFEGTHRPIVDAAIKEFAESGHKRLLTRESYKQYLSQKGIQQGNIYIAVQLHDKCFVGTDADVDDLGSLKKQLIESYIARKSQRYLADFADTCKKRGYLEAAQELTHSLHAAISVTETRRVFYGSGEELKDEYMKELEALRNEDTRIRCGIDAVDTPITYGFKPQHLTLFVADTGGHKCLAHYEKCMLDNGLWITASELRYRTHGGEKLSILSYDDQEGKLYYQPVRTVLDNGDKECWRVTTSLGFSVDVTDNHPFLQLHGYEEAGKLKVGEHVGIARNYKFGDREVHPSLSCWLGCMYSDGGTSQPLYTFTNLDDTLVEAMRISCKFLKGELKQKKVHGEIVAGNYYITGLRHIGIEYGLDKCKSINKSLHPIIFSWNKRSLKVFLKAMFECDGCFRCEQEAKRNGNTITRCSVIYSSSSKLLAAGVRDLLMRFNIVAKLDHLKVKYKGDYNDSWQVKIRDSYQVCRFVEEIGFYDHCDKYTLSKQNMLNWDINPNRNKDLIPSAVWKLIDRKFVLRGKSYNAYREAKASGIIKRLAKRGVGVNRDSLADLAEYLDDPQLRKLAHQEVLWDKIVSIESVGKHKTYDIAMPVHHNFVTNGFITHNTNMMLNIGLNIADRGHGVLFIPLEMSRFDLLNRVVSNRTGIPMEGLTEPKTKLSDEDMAKIANDELWVKSQRYFHILDADERTSVITLKHEIESKAAKFKPKVVIIDYVDTLETDAHNKYGQRHIEIGAILKDLRFLGKRHGFHIISAAQMNRAAIRAWKDGKQDAIDSTSIHGSHQYSADSDTIFALLPHKDEDDKIKVHVVKARHGRSGQTYEVRIDPACCLITNVSEIEHMAMATEFDTDAILDTPEEKIKQEISAGINFAGAPDLNLPDDDDEVAKWG